MTDLIAEDFFDTETAWSQVRPEPLTEIADGSFAKQISRRLAHLTWDRASRTKPSWGAFRIAWELGSSLKVFVAAVHPFRLGHEIVEDVTALMLVLRGYVEQFGSVDDVESVPLSKLLDEEGFSATEANLSPPLLREDVAPDLSDSA